MKQNGSTPVKPLVLVTGATGFAGSHMADLLIESGYPVRALVRTTSDLRWVPLQAEQVTADLRDVASLRRLVDGVRWVFHFAGATRALRPAHFFRVNTTGTLELWQALREHADEVELFLFVSSLAASGPAPFAEAPRKESDEARPISPYGESKLAAEQGLREQADPRIRQLVVRPPTVYGPRDDMVLAFFRWARRGIAPLPAPRGSRLSLIHARDLASACLTLAEGGSQGTFHVDDGHIHSWEQIADLAERALGRRLRRWRLPSGLAHLAGEIGEWLGRLSGRVPPVNRDKVRDILQPYWICDGSRARAAGFRAEIPAEEGIPRTVHWYRDEGWL
ncbi:MAG: NAD-dependent epimerase/dehydratase family protein [Candidatus Eisenbacteria bacterium]|nr:NAD-dependent epimerase/dehydratase family protein [Candidatus Eisenbacteria bacterium]